MSIDDAEDSISEILHEIGGIKVGSQDLPVEIQDYLDSTLDHYREIKRSLRIPLDNRKSVLDFVDSQINEMTKDYMARGYMINGLYATNVADAQTEREDRPLPMREETISEVISRIGQYADWRYPGLEIGPGDGIWTPNLVACDPLYVVDIHQEFLDSTRSKFNQEYQQRIRTYHIDRFATHDHDLSQLPIGQFGFVFAWNVFNYFPLENLKEYLQEIHRALRPGGVCMFSYNDGENPVSVEYAENGWMSYMPKTLLISMCENLLNFEVLHVLDREDNISWIELRKPGTLTTVKAHQALGEIKQLPNNKVLDKVRLLI